jgi:hypothetical protein
VQLEGFDACHEGIAFVIEGRSVVIRHHGTPVVASIAEEGSGGF